MKTFKLFIAFVFCFCFVKAQINGSLMQHPDVSNDQVTFVYGDDVWVANKTGGKAYRLSSPEGPESYPRFSPDGKMIAYTANYNGNNDVFIINSNGGIPKRLTYHGMNDRVLGWTPDGKSVLFASSRESGRQRFNQFYTIDIKGGTPKKLSVPYGEYGSFSPDGTKFAFTDKSRVNRNWKRYRGGMGPDISIFDLKSLSTENITNNQANDELPMWHGNSIYYMSDNGPEGRNNIWKYDIESKSHTQLTKFTEYDITFPENGPKDIVFEAGGKLYLLNLETNEQSEIKVQIVSDQRGMISKIKNVSQYMQNATISPDGNRVVVQARGELFNLPAHEGYVANITSTSGSAERKPAWSPDGKSIAYWSDESGEYQLVVHDVKGLETPKTITNFKKGFNYSIYWSPDSKMVAYVDNTMTINLIEINSGKVEKIDKAYRMFEGNLRNFSVEWSPDSKFIAYAKDTENPAARAIFLYDVQNKKLSQLTSGFYSDNFPTFSADGKHLFFTTNRSFRPVYSDLDNTFIYPNTTGIAVGTLAKATPSLLEIKNDGDTKDEKEEDKEEDKEDENKKDKDSKAEGEKDKKPVQTTIVNVDGFENRVEMIDIPPGNLGNLKALKDKLLFNRYPNSGSPRGEDPSLDFYDINEKEVKSIISKVFNYEVSADGKKVLVMQNGKLAVIDIKPKQKIEKFVPVDDITMTVVPQEEWKQIFNEVWRLERDYFYDPNMHGVDWDLMKKRYYPLVEQAGSRSDVNLIIGDLIAELNASHTYNGGGDLENPETMNVGYLGADFVIDNNHYKISNIVEGAEWDVEMRSPLSKPGLDIKEGDYLLAINGHFLDINKPISAALQNLGDKAVQLTYNSKPSIKGAKTAIVKTLSSETRLRHLEWIESNRMRVDEATNGKAGYIYVRSTGVDGQNELIRQFYGQMHKEGLIIDERFNSGGQIPDRFIELLDRDPLAFWAVRDGKDWSWPPSGNFAPKVMLINGFSGSGGDAFPDYFKKRGLGPVIGTRTWGGLIGISGAPGLIDNGGVTVPTFRMYDPDGKWFNEGYGVDPTIEVKQDFGELAKGKDVQLERAIEELKNLMESNKSFKKPARPKYEVRN